MIDTVTISIADFDRLRETEKKFKQIASEKVITVVYYGYDMRTRDRHTGTDVVIVTQEEVVRELASKLFDCDKELRNKLKTIDEYRDDWQEEKRKVQTVMQFLSEVRNLLSFRIFASKKRRASINDFINRCNRSE